MIKIAKIYPKDLIALVVLVFSLVLITKGINAIVSGIVIMIITYYFSKRVYEEKNPNGDLKERMNKLEKDRTIIAKFGDVPKKSKPIHYLPQGQSTSGDFKQLPASTRPTNQNKDQKIE